MFVTSAFLEIPPSVAEINTVYIKCCSIRQRCNGLDDTFVCLGELAALAFISLGLIPKRFDVCMHFSLSSDKIKRSPSGATPTSAR